MKPARSGIDNPKSLIIDRFVNVLALDAKPVISTFYRIQTANLNLTCRRSYAHDYDALIDSHPRMVGLGLVLCGQQARK